MAYCCDICGRAIKIDTIVPDALWQCISPTGDEAGLLCATCMIDRMHDLDLGREWSAARLAPAHEDPPTCWNRERRALERICDMNPSVTTLMRDGSWRCAHRDLQRIARAALNKETE
jgi:hypothetical protein